MSSASETGHAKNAANLENLISFCAGYGAAYNPSKAEISLAALTTLRTNALNSFGTLNTAKTAFINAVNARVSAFAPLKKLCTKIINALDAAGASDQLVKDAKSINLKIQGRRSSPKPKSPAGAVANASASAEDKTISVSQQSSNSLVENFAKLIELLSAEPTYSPNEADLQVSALMTTLGHLKTVNTEVINTYTHYNNARITRNTILYSPMVGLVDIAGDVKKYVKSVFGAGSPQFKQLGKLVFRKVKD